MTITRSGTRIGGRPGTITLEQLKKTRPGLHIQVEKVGGMTVVPINNERAPDADGRRVVRWIETNPNGAVTWAFRQEFRLILQDKEGKKVPKSVSGLDLSPSSTNKNALIAGNYGPIQKHTQTERLLTLTNGEATFVMYCVPFAPPGTSVSFTVKGITTAGQTQMPVVDTEGVVFPMTADTAQIQSKANGNPDWFDRLVQHIINVHSQTPVRLACVRNIKSLSLTKLSNANADTDSNENVRVDYETAFGEHSLAEALWHEGRHCWQHAMVDKYGDGETGFFTWDDGLPLDTDDGLDGDDIEDKPENECSPDRYDKHPYKSYADGAYWLAGTSAGEGATEQYHTFLKEKDAWDIGDPEGKRPGHTVRPWEQIPTGE